MADAFLYRLDPRLSPTERFIAVQICAGLAFLGLIPLLRRWRPGARTLAAAVAAGLAMRAVFFGADPILEDDWRRYVWDGAVTAAGANPFLHTPREADPYDILGRVKPAAEPGGDLAAMRALAAAHPLEFSRVSYPTVSTIYPPPAQAAFALAHRIAPFSPDGLRAVWIGAELLTLVLLLAALRAWGRSPGWALLYWWNPVVIAQGAGALHMDVLLGPPLALALLLSARGRLVPAAAALGIAAAIKIWPVLLTAALMRPLLGVHVLQPSRWAWGRLSAAAAAFLATALGLLHPQLAALDADSGLAAYSAGWERHAFLFNLIEAGWSIVFMNPGDAARLTAAALGGLVAAGSALASPADGSKTPAAMLAAAAGLIWLSPTGYPWYLIWLAPLLPFAPSAGVAALVATAPLYAIRFLTGDDDPVFRFLVTPAAFGLPLALLALEAIRRARRA